MPEILNLIRLLVFVSWISVTMYLAAKPSIETFNREFSGLIIATACLFFGLISGEVWMLGFCSYLGIRTYQKKLEGENGKINTEVKNV